MIILITEFLFQVKTKLTVNNVKTGLTSEPGLEVGNDQTDEIDEEVNQILSIPSIIKMDL